MNTRWTGIVAYWSFVGFIVAYLGGDKEGAKFHLNQGLVVDLLYVGVYIITFMPIIRIAAWILYLALIPCTVFGIIWAAKEQENELPVIGKIKILK